MNEVGAPLHDPSSTPRCRAAQRAVLIAMVRSTGRSHRDNAGVGQGRLIGHGGVPVYAPHEPLVPPAPYQYTTSFPTAWDEWALMGFAVVELRG